MNGYALMQNYKPMTLEEQRKAVEAVLIAKGIGNFIVAGGYPRDLHYDAKPKDVDIWVCGFDTDDYTAVTELAQALDVSVEVLPMYPDRLIDPNPNTEGIAYVLKWRDVDVILMNSKVQTPYHVVNRFDANLNQWVLVDGDPVYWGEGVVPVYRDEFDARMEVSETRRTRQQAKIQQLLIERFV